MVEKKVVAVWYLYSDRKKMAGGFTVHQRKSLSAPITKIYAGRFSAAGGSWRSMNTLGGSGQAHCRRPDLTTRKW